MEANGTGTPNYKVQKTLTGHTKGVVSLKFSEGDTDGKWLASASGDCTAKIWNSASGELVHTLSGHTRGLSDVTWESRGAYLCTASDDLTLRLWDFASGKCLRILEGHTNYVFCCDFNPHGNMLVSGSFDETVKVWDVRCGRCIRTIPAHSDPVTAVEFNKDGTVILSSSFDGLCRLWDTETGQCLKTIIDTSNPPVSSARFSPNGRYLLIGSLEGRMKLWEYEKGRAVKTYTGHVNVSHCLHSCLILTHPAGQLILTGSEDSSAYLYDLQKQVIVQKLHGKENAEAEGDGHHDIVFAVAHHPTRSLLATGSGQKECSIKLWDDALPTVHAEDTWPSGTIQEQ